MQDFPFSFAFAFGGWFLTEDIAFKLAVFIQRVESFFNVDVFTFSTADLAARCALTFVCFLIGFRLDLRS